MATCIKCGERVPNGKFQCPKCRAWQMEEKIESVSRQSILLRDVKSSDEDRIQTGPWDEIFGTSFKTGISGITRSSTNLIAGSPGAGKSTLFLQIADAVAEKYGEVLYLPAEEPEDQIKARADRLEIENQHLIRIVPVMTGEGDIAEVVARYSPTLLILDSISAMAGDNMATSITIAKAIKQFCAARKLPALISSHVNKGGDIGGLEALQHEVDSTIEFFPDGDAEDENVPRVLSVRKNRNGRAFISYALSMTEKGLVPYESE